MMFPLLPPQATPVGAFLCAVVGACLAGVVAKADGDGAGPRDPQGILRRGPYLQSGTPTGMVIVWRTTGQTLPIVRYGASPEGLDAVVFPTQMVIRQGPDVAGPPDTPSLHSAPPMTYQYEAYLSGLQPDTLYYYAICDGQTLLAGADGDHSFRTLPVAGAAKPLRFWVVGDSGDGSLNQRSGFSAMLGYVAGDGRPVDHYLHLGDMAYGTGLDSEFQSNFFQIYRDLMRNTVTWPTMGNHEGITSSGISGIGPYYDAYVLPTRAEAGGLASGTEAYYSFDIGKVHLICLDSHDLPRLPTGAMAQWLQADLEQTSADWLIAFWHHPPYTKGTHNSDTEIQLIEMREFIVPILEASGVDLVLAGHSHIYERSMLIDGAYVTPTTSDGVVLDDGDGRPDGEGGYEKSAGLSPREGSVHVVAGHGRGGASFYGLMPVMRETITGVGSVLLDIDGDTLTGRMIDGVGDVRDIFALRKSGVVPPRTPLEYPWNPVGPHFRVASRVAGTSDVEIRAHPAAPDAVVRYTLDGSAPDAASPVYTGPLTVAPGTEVRAASAWRGGERTSPVAIFMVTPSPVSPLKGARVLRLPVASPGDEAVERADGSVILGGKSLSFPKAGTVTRTGLRFEGVEIPPGALVLGAGIAFEAAEPGSVGSTGEIGGEAAASPAEFSQAAGDLTSRSLGEARVAWTVPVFSFPGQAVTTPDLSPVVGEAVGRPGWDSGNPLVFLLSGEAERSVRGVEGSWAGAATLSITYYEGEGIDFLLDQPLTVQSYPGFAGGNLVRATYVRPRPDSGWSFGTQLEESLDLKENSWGPADDFSVSGSPIAGTSLESVSVTRFFVDGEIPAALFLRLRVSALLPP